MAAKTWVSSIAGNWSTGTNWNPSGAPAAGDDVTFDGTLGNGNCTLDVVPNQIQSLRFTGGTTDYTGTFDFNNKSWTIGSSAAGNNIAFSSGMTVQSTGGTPTWRVDQTANFTLTLTSNGKTLPVNLNIQATTANNSRILQLADALNIGANTLTLTNSQLDTNGKTVTIGNFASSSSNTRTLTLGASTITCSSGGTPWDITTGTNLTMTANTASITLSGTATTFQGGSKTYGGTVSQTGSGTCVLSGANTIANYTRTGTAAKSDTLSINANHTISNVLTLTGNSTVNRIFVQSSAAQTARIITVNGSVSLTNCDFRGITTAGSAGTWTGTSIGDALFNTGITFTVAAGTSNGGNGVNRYRVGTGANWSDTASWSTTDGGSSGASVPLPQDDVYFTSNSGTGTTTMDMPRACRNIDCTGYTATLTLGATPEFHGSVTWGSGMTLSGNSTTTLRGTGTLTTNGIAFPFTSASLQFTGIGTAPGPTMTLGSNLVINSGGLLVLGAGIMDCAGFTVQSTIFSPGSGTSIRQCNMGGGAWTLTRATSNNIWTYTGTGFTLNVQGSTVTSTGNGAFTPTITTGGLTMPDWTHTGTTTLQLLDGYTGNMAINGSGTFDFNGQTITGTLTGAGGTITNSTGTATATTINITSGTNTFTASKTFNCTTLSGTGGAIQSSSAGTDFTINASSLGRVKKVSVKDCTAAGATNFTCINGTNVSGNTNWTFKKLLGGTMSMMGV